MKTALALFAFAWVLGSCATAQVRKAESHSLEINGHEFFVELARSSEEWARGLMFRKHLGERQGMFFVGETPQLHKFWMKNTYLSLDIIFISSELKILNIAENTTPLSLEGIPSEGLALHVLELKAGSAKRFGLRPGQSVRLNFTP